MCRGAEPAARSTRTLCAKFQRLGSLFVRHPCCCLACNRSNSPSQHFHLSRIVLCMARIERALSDPWTPKIWFTAHILHVTVPIGGHLRGANDYPVMWAPTALLLLTFDEEELVTCARIAQAVKLRHMGRVRRLLPVHLLLSHTGVSSIRHSSFFGFGSLAG